MKGEKEAIRACFPTLVHGGSFYGLCIHHWGRGRGPRFPWKRRKTQ